MFHQESKTAEKKEQDDDNCKITPPAIVDRPLFQQEVLSESPKFGVLGKLEGVWVNTEKTGFGLHTTCLPLAQITSRSPGNFIL